MISPFFKRKDPAENQLKTPAVPMVQPEEEPGEDMEVKDASESMSGLISTGKNQLDKKSLDLIFSVEQIIQARQHAETTMNELQDRLTHSSGCVERLNRDVKNLNKVIDEREKHILDLEHKLIEKNLKVDQVMEDYRELQAALSAEIDELKSTIDLEQQKYINVVQKHNEVQADKLKKMNDLEERISRTEIENSHLKQKYETLRQEKAYLSSMISDFTNRMTLPFGNVPAERKDGHGDT
jgi:chromosome segregation ATPase